MKKNSLIKIIFLLFLFILLIAVSSRAEPRELIILTTSDLHGQLEPFAAEKDNGTSNAGGITRIASVVKTIKKLEQAKNRFNFLRETA